MQLARDNGAKSVLVPTANRRASAGFGRGLLEIATFSMIQKRPRRRPFSRSKDYGGSFTLFPVDSLKLDPRSETPGVAPGKSQSEI